MSIIKKRSGKLSVLMAAVAAVFLPVGAAFAAEAATGDNVQTPAAGTAAEAPKTGDSKTVQPQKPGEPAPQAAAGSGTDFMDTDFEWGRQQSYWLTGYKIGLSVMTGDYLPVVDAPVGYAGNLSIERVFGDMVGAGLMFDFDFAGVTDPVTDDSIGTGSTFSILPYADVRYKLPGTKFRVTGTAGAGINLNGFSEDKSLAQNVKPDHTFSFRAGLGGEYEVSRRSAIGLEVAYKLNKGDADISGTKVDYDASQIQIMAGWRLAF